MSRVSRSTIRALHVCYYEHKTCLDLAHSHACTACLHKCIHYMQILDDIALHPVTSHRIELHRTALHCIALDCSALHCVHMRVNKLHGLMAFYLARMFHMSPTTAVDWRAGLQRSKTKRHRGRCGNTPAFAAKCPKTPSRNRTSAQPFSFAKQRLTLLIEYVLEMLDSKSYAQLTISVLPVN